MTKNRFFIPCYAILLFVALSISGPFTWAKSEADLLPAFRSPAITEAEFLARSISFGVTPIATLLGEQRLPRPELQQELQSKLVSAQLEWIDLQASKKPNSEGATIGAEIRTIGAGRGAIDALLDLEHKEDWNEDAQNIFLEFLVRKATLLRQDRPEPKQQLDQLYFQIARHTKQRSIDSVAPETQRSGVFQEARKLADLLTPSIQRFENLPDDVVGVIVNGVWHPKSQGHFAFYISPNTSNQDHDRNKVRVTFISNLYQPKTLMIAQSQQVHDLGHRQAWVRSMDSCSVDSSHYLSVASPLAVVGNDSCESLIGPDGTTASNASLKQISDFGRGNIPRDPFHSTPPIEQPPTIRPWVWAAIGSVAVVALVISARTKDTQMQPTMSSGW